MNQEELRKKYNPDGSDLRKLQMRMLEMLLYIDDVCKKNNITYWLSSGTLLGAVRHGGFIPWDDDLDIEMPEKEFVKLLKILKEKFKTERPSKYVLQHIYSDDNYFFSYAKLRDKKTIVIEDSDSISSFYTYKGAFIDIFPLVHTSSFLGDISGGVQILLAKLFVKFNHSRVLKKLIKKINFFNIKVLYPLLISISKIFINKNTLRYTLGCGYKLSQPRYLSDIYPLSNVSFEGYTFPAPEDYDSYLNNIYGDYMEIPEKEDRRQHLQKIIFQSNYKI